MTRRRTLTAHVVLCSFFLGLGASLGWAGAARSAPAGEEGPASTPEPQNRILWSYRCGETSPLFADRALNDLGDYGWELVSSNSIMLPGSMRPAIFYCMKRPRQPAAPSTRR